ncbi:hypothetical protein KEJ27_00255 [Candidatus Bathyarchaeota archaeon]|nr:hypothetical protein [Candidatus Bathyarchaeota archaeon]
MVLKVEMIPIRIYVHKDDLNRLLYELGRLEALHLIDTHKTLKEYGGTVEFVEPSEELFRISPLISRVKSLLSALNVEVEEREASGLPLTESLPSLLDRVEKKVGNLEEEVTRIREDLAELEKRMAEGESLLEDAERLKGRLNRLAEEEGDELNELLSVLNALKAMKEAEGLAAKTRSVYIIDGWTTRARFEEVSECVKRCGGYPSEIPNVGERPPVVMRNPYPFNIFEPLVRALGLPGYGEIDPTAMFLITFPLLFGLAFGDLGHGMLLLIIALLLRYVSRRSKGEAGGIVGVILGSSTILLILSLSAMLFGFLYGEFFGSEEWFEVLTGLHEPPWFSPSKEPMKLFKYCIVVAILHISMGLILDLINKVSTRRFKDALTGPVVWLWLYWSGSYLVLTYGWDVFKLILEPTVVVPFLILPLTVMVVGRAFIHGGEGFGHSLESFIESMSHTISYVRILALNMIHGAFSKMLLPKDAVGVLPFVLGTLFLIMGIELLLSFLHVLRLHWVEWFTKFYSGTGIEYKPFTLKGRT